MPWLPFIDEGAAAAPPDDDLPACFAYSQVWQIPYLPGGATINGQDLQEILWNVRVPNFDISGATIISQSRTLFRFVMTRVWGRVN